MSQTSTLEPAGRSEATEETELQEEKDLQRVLESFADPICRRILKATSTDPLSAGEISEICDLPQSTTYRKIDQLQEAGLVEERTRLGTHGNHSSEYVVNVQGLELSVDPDGDLEFDLSERPTSDGTANDLAN